MREGFGRKHLFSVVIAFCFLGLFDVLSFPSSFFLFFPLPLLRFEVGFSFHFYGPTILSTGGDTDGLVGL